jgi:hypothetical protein
MSILKNDIFSTSVTQATNIINVGYFGGVRSASHGQVYFDIFSTFVTQITNVINVGCFGGCPWHMLLRRARPKIGRVKK